MRSIPRRWFALGRLGLGLVVVVSASLGVGMMLWAEPAGPDGSTARSHSTPALPPSVPQAGQLDESTRVSTIDGVALTLPADPYVLYTDPVRMTGALDPAFMAGARVQRAYDGHRDWYAEVVFGLVAPSNRVDTDLETLARQTLLGLSRTVFDNHPTRVRHVQVFDHAVDGRSGVTLTAQVGYRVPGLRSRSDHVTLQVVRADDGSTVAAVATVPEDAPPAVAQQAVQALATLRFG